MDPAFGKDDECGLEYFKIAVGINLRHVECLHGIVDTFGSLACDHQDIEAARQAASTLRSMSSLPKFVKDSLDRFGRVAGYAVTPLGG